MGQWVSGLRGFYADERRDFVGTLGVAAAIAVALDRDNLGVVREAIDEGDGAGRIGKDGVPLLERQI